MRGYRARSGMRNRFVVPWYHGRREKLTHTRGLVAVCNRRQLFTVNPVKIIVRRHHRLVPATGAFQKTRSMKDANRDTIFFLPRCALNLEIAG